MTQGQSLLLRGSLECLEKLAIAVKMNWLTILVGQSAAGKSSLVENFAQLCGRKLQIFNLSSDTDALELLGSFEQVLCVRFCKILHLFCSEILGLRIIRGFF